MVLFETERLAVRHFTAGDAEDFFRFNSHPEVMRYIRPVKNRESAAAFLAKNLNLYLPGSCLGRFFVAEKTTGQFIGSFSLLYMSLADDIHIGYGLMPEYWGQGYALELLKAGVLYFFSNSLRNSLYAITEPANTASRKVLEKAGFLFSRQIKDGKMLDLFLLERKTKETTI